MKPVHRFFLGCFCFLVCLAVAAPGRAQDLKVTEMAVTTKIVRGNPIDAVRRISSTSVKALYCFTRLVNPGGSETVVKHVWYKDEKPVSEQVLKVKGEKWRTWSKRLIDRESVGEWRVDALDSDGKLLKSVKFRIN
ncbi:MAG TPA: DUF2914 domain-containing protein [Geobacteraceae bacterium]|nr:DUF2914 domain-containing protein [Geobacteraceae bacterium]